jgi:hypothetical protein
MNEPIVDQMSSRQTNAKDGEATRDTDFDLSMDSVHDKPMEANK